MERTKLMAARARNHWTLAQAAERLQVDINTVYRWERGLATPRAYNLQRLCDVYGVVASELDLENRLMGKHPIVAPDGMTTEELGFISEPQTIKVEEITSRHDFLEAPLVTAQPSFVSTLDQEFVSRNGAFRSDIAARLTQALTKPSNLDEKTLLYLERRIANYWQDRNDVALAACDLLPYVLEDLQRATTLLEGSLRPTVRTHLCSIAGTAAMLIGELYYDMSNYAQARLFQELAIAAAREANNASLEAVAWARNSFAWTYDGNPDEACNSIRQARHLGWSVNSTVRTWLAAVEAEVQAHLGNRTASLKALSEAALVEDQKHQKEECYWIHFDRSLFAGYQGVSFLRLSSLGHKDLVQNAQTALQDALALLDPSMKRRQPTLFVDLAGTYVQQQNIEQACGCALKAINIATQINSKVSVQRLLLLRRSLEQWKETTSVQALDQALGPLFIPRRQ